MFKRIMLSLTFLAAFGLVGVVTPDSSEARRYWRRRPFVGRYYYAPPRAYYRSYRPYYYGAPPYYGYPGDSYYYGPRRGVYFRFGF